MTEQHTPGPWRIGDAGTAVFPPKEVFASKPHAIASNLSRANARLIAAAPELLMALERAARECEEYSDIAKPPVRARVQRVAREARAVIAKAKE